MKKLYVVKGTGIGISVKIPEAADGGLPTYGRVRIDTQLWGKAPTWEDILASMYWGEEPIGDFLERAARHAHMMRGRAWRVEVREGEHGHVDYLVREKDEAAETYGGAGKITASLHISCAGKLNEGIPIVDLKDWYVLLKAVPRRHMAEILRDYEESPPKEIQPITAADIWHAPGVEPWAGDAL